MRVEPELVGSFRFNDEIEAVIDALADHSLCVDPVITHEFPAARALEALAVVGDASRSLEGPRQVLATTIGQSATSGP